MPKRRHRKQVHKPAKTETKSKGEIVTSKLDRIKGESTEPSEKDLEVTQALDDPLSSEVPDDPERSTGIDGGNDDDDLTGDGIDDDDLAGGEIDDDDLAAGEIDDDDLAAGEIDDDLNAEASAIAPESDAEEWDLLQVRATSRSHSTQGALPSQMMLEAIMIDDNTTAAQVLRRGLDPNSKSENEVEFLDEESTLLHWTATYGSPRCAKVATAYPAKRSHSVYLQRLLR